MPTARTIRKYPNRRLYDTFARRYVTLVDLRQLICDQVDFVVLDSRTDEDISKPALLQVIAEEERRGAKSLLSRGLMLKLIRAYGSPVQNSISVYLEQSLAMLLAAEKRDGNDFQEFYRVLGHINEGAMEG